MKYVLISILALCLSACATTKNAPADMVYKANASFNVSLIAAIQYAKLPRCNDATPEIKICSKQEIIERIVATQQATAQSLDNAEAAIKNPNATTASINTAITSMNIAIAAMNAAVMNLPRN